MANLGTTLGCGINPAGKTGLCDFLHFKLGDILKKYFLVVLLLLAQNVSNASTLAHVTYNPSWDPNAPPLYSTSANTSMTAWCTWYYVDPVYSTFTGVTDIVPIYSLGSGIGSFTFTCNVFNNHFFYGVDAQGYAVYGPKALTYPNNGSATCPADTLTTSWTGDDYICGTGPLECTAPLVPDAAGTRCVTGPPPCTAIDALPDLPKDDKDYACTQSLDKGAGKDVDKVCPPHNPLNEKLPGEMECLANKLAALSPPIPYDGPSSTIRTKAYQQHLLEIYKKSEDLKNKKLSSAQKQACAARIADIGKQMKDHGIKFEPSDQEEAAPHVQGIAFDIPKSVATALLERATMTRIKPIFQTNYPGCISCMHIPLVTGDVQDYINSSVVHPPACNLDWGGSFGDIVHFQLQQP
jgi:hypothetical protein